MNLALSESERLTGISEEGQAYIQSLIENYSVTKTIEIGCGPGLSSLAICEALSKKDSPSHVIVDPYESTSWEGRGVARLKERGYDFFELIEEPSELALPELLKKGRVFDFALIDGWHTFDQTLVDFFYVNRLLRVGGIVAFDDIHMPSVNKVARYVNGCPHYQYLGEVINTKARRRKLNTLLHRTIISLFPLRLRNRVFRDSFLNPMGRFGRDVSLAAFQKTEEDARSWDWYQAF